MTKLTKLPENWYVKVENEEQQKVYKNYFDKVCPENSWNLFFDHCYGYYNKNYLHGGAWVGRGVLITFEQFKKWVLKEEVYIVEVVHCETQEQWDFVSEKLNYNWHPMQSGWWLFCKFSCINLNEKDYHSISHYQKENYKIYTFQEWCDKFGHTNPFKPKSLVGRYLKALKDNPYCYTYKKGDYIEIIEDNLKNKIKCKREYIYFHENYNFNFSEVELMPEGFDPNTKTTTKFEVGKWYEYSAEYINHKTYAKYSANQSVGRRFYYDEIITENNGFKKEHNWSVLTCKPVLLTDLSEIQQYLPDNHPDKIKPIKNMFKKDDYIVTTLKTKLPDTEESLLEEVKRKYPVGTVIKKISGNDFYTIQNDLFAFYGDNTIIHKLPFDDDSYSVSTIYQYGKWAEIISLPETKKVNNSNTDISCDSNFYSNNPNQKLEIYTKPIEPIILKPITELKLKQVNNLTIK